MYIYIYIYIYPYGLKGNVLLCLFSVGGSHSHSAPTPALSLEGGMSLEVLHRSSFRFKHSNRNFRFKTGATNWAIISAGGRSRQIQA